MAYDNTNSGAIFKNEKKTKENQPDYRGPLNIKGEEGEIACWLKEKNGKKYFSCKWQPKEDRPQQDHQAPLQGQGPAGGPDMGDNIPFAPLREMP